jgi:hypothetical protein
MSDEPTNNVTDDYFQFEPFARYYNELSDAFIDMEAATSSLKSQITKDNTLFEIGLGTGYFAGSFHNDGYNICGIQPNDQMLLKLKQDYPGIRVKGEAYLQDYVFDDQYDVIISHSSVFLFTKLTSQFPTGERLHFLLFQSFINAKQRTIENLLKVMNALTSNGKFFINIQTNPKHNVEIGEHFSFGLDQCDYYADLNRVDKVFRTTRNGTTDLSKQPCLVIPYHELKRIIDVVGCQIRVSEDFRWVILGNQK